MAIINTRYFYLIGLYIAGALVFAAISGCGNEQKGAPAEEQQADVFFEADNKGISTKTDGYALRFENDAIYIQTPDDMDGWVFQIGNSDNASIEANSWNDNQLLYKNIYPSINLRFFDEGNGDAGYDFQVRKGGDPSKICLLLKGNGEAHLSSVGELVLPTANGEIRHSTPVAYQYEGEDKKYIKCAFVLKDDECLGFKVGNYDTSKMLIIE